MASAVALGIDVGGTKLVAATLGADGSLLERRRHTTPANDQHRLVQTLQQLIEDLGADLPVGVGMPGLVDLDGTFRHGPNVAVRDLALVGALAGSTSGAVVVINDASAAAFGEQQFGAARGVDDVVMFTLGTGVGGGLVLGGRLRLGAHGFGAELGHVIVSDAGRLCPCGNHGCLEAYASGSAIGARGRERAATASGATVLHGDVTGGDVTAAARDGDQLAQEILREAGYWLGVAAAGLVHVLDPQLILVGGGAAIDAAPWILPAAQVALDDRLLGRSYRDAPRFALASLGDDAGMIGAATLAAHRQGIPLPEGDT